MNNKHFWVGGMDCGSRVRYDRSQRGALLACVGSAPGGYERAAPAHANRLVQARVTVVILVYKERWAIWEKKG